MKFQHEQSMALADDLEDQGASRAEVEAARSLSKRRTSNRSEGHRISVRKCKLKAKITTRSLVIPEQNLPLAARLLNRRDLFIVFMAAVIREPHLHVMRNPILAIFVDSAQLIGEWEPANVYVTRNHSGRDLGYFALFVVHSGLWYMFWRRGGNAAREHVQWRIICWRNAVDGESGWLNPDATVSDEVVDEVVAQRFFLALFVGDRVMVEWASNNSIDFNRIRGWLRINNMDAPSHLNFGRDMCMTLNGNDGVFGTRGIVVTGDAALGNLMDYKMYSLAPQPNGPNASPIGPYLTHVPTPGLPPFGRAPSCPCVDVQRLANIFFVCHDVYFYEDEVEEIGQDDGGDENDDDEEGNVEENEDEEEED